MKKNYYKLISYSDGIISYLTEKTESDGLVSTLNERLCYRIDHDGQEVNSDPQIALQDLLKGKIVINAYNVDEGGPVRRVIEELIVEPVS